MEIPTDKISIIILDLVIHIQAELIVMRNDIENSKLSSTLTSNMVEENFDRNFKEARKAVLANIKANYILENDTDKSLGDLISNLNSE